MGISTDAILCYGIQVEDLDERVLSEPYPELPDDLLAQLQEDFSADELLAALYGWRPSAEDPYAWSALKTLPVALEPHCSEEHRRHVLTIPSSVTRAYRGYPESIENLNVESQWDKVLQDACRRLGLTYTQPRWWLQSELG